MNPILAQVDWVFLTLAGFVLVMLLTWPPFKRMVREMNLAFAEGDEGRALDAALRLHRSWLPLAVLERLLTRGKMELFIAERFFTLGEVEQSLRWCEQGLRITSKPVLRTFLHTYAALCDAHLNRIDDAETHLKVLQSIASKSPPAAASSAPLASSGLRAAISCYSFAGRFALALAYVDQALAQFAGPPDLAFLNTALLAMAGAGRFDIIFRWTAPLVQDSPPSPQPSDHAPGGASADLAQDQVLRAARKAQEAVALLTAMAAAGDAGRWDLQARYLQKAFEQGTLKSSLELARLSGQTLQAAHLGKREEVVAFIDKMEELTATYPRSRRMAVAKAMSAAHAWELLGEHERTLAAIEGIDTKAISPAGRSELAALAARSLEALGRYEEAELRRQEAIRLAPDGHWNRAPAWTISSNEPAATLAAPPGETPETPITFSPLEPPMPPPGSLRPSATDAPVEPRASSTACAAWVLATFALLPLLGGLFAIALFVLAVSLLARRRPLLHDRRVGWAALAIAVLSLGLTSVTVVHNHRTILAFVSRVAVGGPLPVSPPSSTLAEEMEEGDQEDPAASAPSGGEDEPAAAASPAMGHDADNLPAIRRTQAQRNQPEDGPTTREAFGPEDDSSDPQGPPVAAHKGGMARWQRWSFYVVLAVVLILSIMLHEIGHAVAALWSGDPTARDRGRISLNPLRHIDPVGSIVVPAVLTCLNASVIGWARPVPVRPDRYRHSRRGQLAVSLAGVSLNLMLALLAMRLLTATLILLKWLHPSASGPDLAFLTLLYVSPQVPFASAWSLVLNLWTIGVLLNVMLLWFNLLPVPPLDGYGVVRAIAPRPIGALLGRLSGFATVALLLLIAFKMLDKLLLPAIYLAGSLLACAYAGALGP